MNLNLNFFQKRKESVIGIDTKGEVFHFYSMRKGDKNSIDYFASDYKAKPFEADFYNKFTEAVKLYRENHPSSQLQKATIVLPDSVFLTDSINIPVLNKRAMETSLAVSLSNLYRNSAEIKFNHMLSAQNKQFATYSIIGVRREILTALRDVCSKNQLSISNITFSANAAVNGAFIVNPRLRNASFVLLDIKDNSANIIFVVKGKTLGYYSLPFGSSMLFKTRVAAEDLLFDHSVAELLVLNAKEKAKAKALTMSDDRVNLAAEDENAEPIIADGAVEAQKPAAEATESIDADSTLPEEENEAEVEELISLSGKKTARKLPKFMLRDTPTSREGFVYENFRFFVKWTLDVIMTNTTLTSLAAPEAVYVNLPTEYDFLYEKVNREAEENGLKFLPLAESDLPEHIQKHLELFGAYYSRQFNKSNNFNANQLDVIKSKSAKKKPAGAKGESPKTLGDVFGILKGKIASPTKKSDKKTASSQFKDEYDGEENTQDTTVPMMDKFFKKKK